MGTENQIDDALRILRDIGYIPDPNAEPARPQPRYSTSEAKVLAKFEQFPSEITILAGVAPGNPAHLLQGKRFPRMLYKAQQAPGSGKYATGCELPRRAPGEDENVWNARVEAANRFAESCQMIVQDEVGYSRAHEDGWRDSSQEALAFVEERSRAIAQETLERNARDKKMSEKAQAEVAAAEANHFGHLPEIPEKPKRKYTRRSAAA